MGSGLRDIMCNKGKSNGKIEHEMRAVITDWLMEISVSPNWGSPFGTSKDNNILGVLGVLEVSFIFIVV